jgi:cation:H+ antiporter
MFGLILLIVGLVLVVWGAHWLVDGAIALARRAGISDLAVGLTVVALGTSLPELAVNLFASVEGNPAIVIGNITGSNIANILLILGLSALLFPLEVGKGTVWKEIPFSLLAAAILWLMSEDAAWLTGEPGVISRSEGLILLFFFVIFLYYTAGMAPRLPETSDKDSAAPAMRIFVNLFLGLVLLIAGGKATVSGAVRLAHSAGLSEGFIAASLVAIGTSIPELATSVVAAWKKSPDIAVGNVVGSNLFNIFFILGLSAVIRPLAVPPELLLSIWMTIGASGILFVCMFTGQRHRIDRWEGALMLVLYGLYLWMQSR